MRIQEHLKNIKNHDSPTKFILARILMKTKLCKFLQIKQKHYILKFFPTSLSRELWINLNFQHTANIFFWDYLKPGDNVIDIGANIGTITLECAVKIGDSGKIYSIEPNPVIYEYLCKNISLNHLNNIKSYNIAVGDKNGIIMLATRGSDWGYNIGENSKGINVSLRKLDDISINENEIALMKIDVLGYEKFVLMGAKQILTKVKCIHFPVIEKDFEKYGYNYRDVFEILTNNGFELFNFSTKKEIWPITYNFKPNNEDLLAIKELDDFLKRTGYKITKSE